MTTFEKLRQFAVYCLVGSVNTVIGFAVIIGLSELLHVNSVIANIAGYGVGLAIAFPLHRKITFPGADKAATATRQIGPFLLIFAISYACNLGVLVVLLKSGLANFFSQAIAVGVYVVVSFTGNKYLTFKTPQA